MKKLTESRLIEDAEKVNLEWVGPYLGSLKKTQYKCKNHGIIEMRPSTVQSGSTCKLCIVYTSEKELHKNAKAVNLKFIGPIGLGKDLTNYECAVHGIINMKPAIVVRGHGCRLCANEAKAKPIEDLISDAEKVGLTYIDGYTKTNKNANYLCPIHGVIQMHPGNVYAGSKCKACTIEEQRNSYSRIKSEVELAGYAFISKSYKNTRHKLEIECSHHGLFLMTYDDFRRGRRCASCASHGFDPLKPATFYAIIAESKTDSFVGVGISNEMDVREGTHKRNLVANGYDYKMLMSVDYENGTDAKNLESLLLTSFKDLVYNTGIEGFKREAFKLDAKDSIIEFIETHK